MQHLLNLFAAIALLVWGTYTVRTGILRVMGEDLRRVLRRSVDNRLTAMAAGLGVTMCPSYARPLVQAYGLQMLPMQDPGFYREVCTFSLADKSLSPAAASLLDCLDEAVTELRFAEPVRRAK